MEDAKSINEKTSARVVQVSFMGAGFAGICLLFLLMFTWFQPDQLSLSDRYFPSATPSITPSPTLTPTPSLTPTPTPNLTATAQAHQVQITSLANQWPLLLSDTFETNTKDWDEGNDDDEYAVMTKELHDGVYRWKVTAHKSFIGWQRLETRDLNNFTLSVDGRETQNPNIGEYGLIFREDRDGNLYYFGVNYRQEYFVLINYKGDWDDLIVPTHYNSLRPVGFNKLAIVAQGSHFAFFINDHYVAEVTDDRIKTGTTAMAVSLSRADDKSVFEFDNIELHAP